MSTKKGRYGDPRKRRPLAGDLARLVQPTGTADPTTLGGSVAGPGGSRDRGAVLLGMQDVVLMDSTHVATVDTVRSGELSEQAIYMQLGGRVNKTTRQASVGFIFGPDGAAALITELLALADRFGADLLDDVTRRLTELHQGKHVDLQFLRAAIDNAISASEEP